MTENMPFIKKTSTGIETSWVVITGAPSSGKTTVIQALSAAGYSVFHDVARIVIQELTINSQCIDEHEKQSTIIQKQLEAYITIPKDQLVFLDYGMPDNLVFQDRAGFRLKNAKDAAHLYRYRAVFVMEPLQMEYDGIRDISPEIQRELHDEIVNIYISFGYSPIIIRAESLISRIRNILYHLGEKNADFS